MDERYLGESIPKLGFGFMRLPKKEDGDVDMALLSKMTDVFLAEGFTYFDTAYLYPGSEDAIREALVGRYPRGAYQLATKLPVARMESPEDAMLMFDTSLKRTGAGYFDYYLLHAIKSNNYAKSEEFGAWRFIREQKEYGYIKHIGFSFHGLPELLDTVLTRHPETEFVQLQINYVDWMQDAVQSRRCYEVARAHGKPVTVMEPVKGGLLAGSDSNATDIFKSANPHASAASWAMRFVASLESLITILSGMNSMEQLDDNIRTIKDFVPLTENEYAMIAKATDIFNSTPRIPCTGCRYCMGDCPRNISIPLLLDLYSDYLVFRSAGAGRDMYPVFTLGKGKASDCIRCGQCEKQCPQGIGIADIMEVIAYVYE